MTSSELNKLPSLRPFVENSERLITAEFVRNTANYEFHRAACFQRCLEELPGLIDPDLHVAVTPLHAEAKGMPALR